MKIRVDLITLGIRQIELAKELEIDPATISRILNGWKDADPSTLEKIKQFIDERRNSQKQKGGRR